MSDAVAAMRTYLLTQSGVTDLVATRIYFDNLPQGATLPAIVVEQVNDDIIRSLNATDSLRRTSVNAIVYASSHTSAAAAGDAVESAVEFATGAWGTVTVRRALVESAVDVIESPQDASDAYRNVRSLACVVWHT